MVMQAELAKNAIFNNRFDASCLKNYIKDDLTPRLNSFGLVNHLEIYN
jgi:hypothetical protein